MHPIHIASTLTLTLTPTLTLPGSILPLVGLAFRVIFHWLESACRAQSARGVGQVPGLEGDVRVRVRVGVRVSVSVNVSVSVRVSVRVRVSVSVRVRVRAIPAIQPGRIRHPQPRRAGPPV